MQKEHMSEAMLTQMSVYMQKSRNKRLFYLIFKIIVNQNDFT